MSTIVAKVLRQRPRRRRTSLRRAFAASRYLAKAKGLSRRAASRGAHGPIDKLRVVLSAIFGALFLGEKLAPQNRIGVALIALGAALRS